MKLQEGSWWIQDISDRCFYSRKLREGKVVSQCFLGTNKNAKKDGSCCKEKCPLRVEDE